MKGFAKLDPELRRQISSKGGKAVPAESRTFSLNHDLARKAGKKGGETARDNRKAADGSDLK